MPIQAPPRRPARSQAGSRTKSRLRAAIWPTHFRPATAKTCWKIADPAGGQSRESLRGAAQQRLDQFGNVQSVVGGNDFSILVDHEHRWIARYPIGLGH